MITVKLVTGVAEHFVYRLAEWACASILFFYGLTLLEPGDTFDNPAFAVMKSYASEDTWGTIIVVLAGSRLVALFLNGTFRWSVNISWVVRSVGATLCVFVWFAIALGIYLATVSAPGSRTYGILMLVDTFQAIYLGGKAGAAFRKRKNRGS